MSAYKKNQPKNINRIKKIFSARVLIGVLLALIFLAAIAGGYYYYTSYRQLIENPSKVTKQEAEWLVRKVSNLVILPEGEDPSTATVLDRERLKDQAFFTKAENGDKILIYPKAQKAVLYRPSIDKIIEMMPVSLESIQNDSSGATR